MNNDTSILSYTSTCNDGNIAYHVGDIKKNVDKNRALLAQKLNYNTITYMTQIHSNRVVVVDEHSPLHVEDCDALITSTKELALMVMVADCIAISFYDEVNEVVAVAHAGRNGTFLNIVKSVIENFTTNFNSKVENIKVSLSPSIQKCCYEVDNSMVAIVQKNFGKEFVSGKCIDLQSINKKQLIECGIFKNNIEISTTCTKCSNEPYFSYRRDKKCGRFCSIIMLK
ncbi:MAG: peptidoglycan editing factor PgeF [Campylobacterota bacterium]|nr:peptidoglycan editing factor PgeF [Campylobacterota bacterium]